jgi:uncharacterized membrane protein
MPVNSGRPGFIWMRLRMVWVFVRDSLWFIPALFTSAAAGLAVLLIVEERRQWLPWRLGSDWLLGAGAEGAQQILSAIASGLITVTGVVFSVTIVALQLASSQFTPRLLRNFTADRVNQLVLGVFIGTFTYALLVLGVIRHASPQSEEFVPQMAIVIAVMLVLVSIGFLIYFINHAAASIRISIILDRVARQTLRQIEINFSADKESLPCDDAEPMAWNEEAAVGIAAPEAGYLMVIDAQALFWLGYEKRLLIRMECDIGQFLLPGQMLASAAPAERLDEEAGRVIRKAFVLGPERTPEQDIEFGIIEISDIAVKALSAAINDPTTAMRCIDHLSQILLALGRADPPADVCGSGGQIYFIGRYLAFERAVGLAFKQIQHYGLANPTIMKKLLNALFLLIELVPAARRAPLLEQAELLLEEAASVIASPSGQRELVELAAEFQRLKAAHVQ